MLLRRAVQMMHSVDSARCMHTLGRLLPGLEASGPSIVDCNA